MPLKLFDRKRRCLGSHLTAPNDQMTAISGFGSHVVVGTRQGWLLIFNSANNRHKWEEEAKIQLAEEKHSKAAITQICCASALSLILVIFGNELVGLYFDNELMVLNVFNKARRIALNTHPSIDSNPFTVQLAIAHSQKQLILIGQLSSESEEPAEFHKQHKLSTQGRPTELAFSGQCLCYATTEGAYFVHALGEKAPVRLFDSTDNGAIPRVICAVGKEEFCLSGIHGLLMFVNGQGASTRPPISLPGEFPAAGVTCKEPFLYMLDTSGMLFVFSTLDGQVKQCLDFPNDNEHAELPADCTYQLANIDGQLLVLPPAASDGCLFELVSMAVLAQIEEHIQLGQLDTALAMLEENGAQMVDAREIQHLRELQLQIAFHFLQKAEFEKAIDLLVKSEANPHPMLTLIAQQHTQLRLEEALDGRKFAELPVEGKFPEIPLHIAEQYLERVYAEQWADEYAELLESILARIYTISGEFARTEKLTKSNNGGWNRPAFRQWLSTEHKQPSLAAKLAYQAGAVREAFAWWRGIAESGTGCREELTECFDALESVNDPVVLESILPWLTPIDPDACMAAIKRCEEKTVRPEFVVEHFEKYSPTLLFQFLQKRINSLDSPSLHDKMLDLFIEFAKQEKPSAKTNELANGEEAPKYRQKMRHFLLFSPHYDRQRAARLLAECAQIFRVEAILARANEKNALDCLRNLTARIGADFTGQTTDSAELLEAAELLCTRFPSPDMLNTMLHLHLRLSKSDPAMREHIPRILELLESDVPASEVIQNVPEELAGAALVQHFLKRHCSQRMNTHQWQEVQDRLARAQAKALEKQLAGIKAGTHFRLDESTAWCAFCERQLTGGEQFVREPNSGRLAHFRCHQSRDQPF